MEECKLIIFKELHFVYIVNGKKFLKKEEAEKYVEKMKDTGIFKKLLRKENNGPE